MYLLRSSAHPTHSTKVISFGVATRIRRNCSTEQNFEQISSIYIKKISTPLRFKKQLDKAIKRSQEGSSSHQKHRIRRSCFHSLHMLTQIYPASTKLVVTRAIVSTAHPHHRFFLRVPLSHLLEGPKTSKSFWLVLKVLITHCQIMIHILSGCFTEM